MLYIHPFLQTMTLLLGLYVMKLGWDRFVAQHLGRKRPFLWKRHVFLGKIVFFMWLYGAAVGGAAAWVHWRRFGVTGIHFKIGLLIIIMVLFGYGSGWVLDTFKKKRKYLPLIHGASNLLLVLLTFVALFSGIGILKKLLVGG